MGKFILRPRWKPFSTMPSIRCQCPSMRFASEVRPSERAARIAVDDNSPAASLTSGATVVANPCFGPRAVSISTSPVRCFPNRKSAPTTRCLMLRPSINTSLMKASAVKAAKAVSNGISNRCLRPSFANWLALVSADIRRKERAFGWNRRRGCGSKVITPSGALIETAAVLAMARTD